MISTWGGARPASVDAGAVAVARSSARTREARSAAFVRNRTLAVAVAATTGLAAVDLGVHVKLTQLLVVGPCLAAVSASARTVALAGVYAIGWMTVLSFANGNAGTSQQVVTALGALVVTTIAVAVADRRQHLQGAIVAAERLAAIVAHSDDAMITTTPDGIITSWNPGATHLFGYPPHEMIGTDLVALSTENRGDTVLPGSTERTGSTMGTVLESVRGGRRVEHYRSREHHRDGSDLDLSVSVFPIKDFEGRVLGCCAVCRDITTAVAAETEQSALRTQLHQNQRMESLGHLAGGVAHDFNNLLAVITTSAELIEAETTDPAVGRDIAVIAAAAARGGALTRQLLVFARGGTSTAQELDPAEVVTGISELLTRSVGPAVHVDLSGARTGGHLVRADRGRLEQVLLNLTVNARDVMPLGGSLTISVIPCELVADQPGLVPPPKAGSYVELAVTDTGTGMTGDTTTRIFEPFFTTKSRGTGTGLGLATVYGAVTEAGGSIHVESEPGQGTTFHIYLPAAPRTDGEEVPVGVGAEGRRGLRPDRATAARPGPEPPRPGAAGSHQLPPALH